MKLMEIVKNVAIHKNFVQIKKKKSVSIIDWMLITVLMFLMKMELKFV